jgi:voltage-gated potassium channel
MFAVELVVMLAVVPNRRRWLLDHPIELVVVLLTPPFLPAGLQSIRAIRLLRLLRLLKLAKLSSSVFSAKGLKYASFLALLVAVAGGAVFKAFEAGHQHVTTWDGIFWAVTTMTTLGCQFDATTLGAQITAIVIMVLGICYVAMLTGAAAQRFLSGPDSGAQPQDQTQLDLDFEA